MPSGDKGGRAQGPEHIRCNGGSEPPYHVASSTQCSSHTRTPQMFEADDPLRGPGGAILKEPADTRPRPVQQMFKRKIAPFVPS